MHNAVDSVVTSDLAEFFRCGCAPETTRGAAHARLTRMRGAFRVISRRSVAQDRDSSWLRSVFTSRSTSPFGCGATASSTPTATTSTTTRTPRSAEGRAEVLPAGQPHAARDDPPARGAVPHRVLAHRRRARAVRAVRPGGDRQFSASSPTRAASSSSTRRTTTRWRSSTRAKSSARRSSCTAGRSRSCSARSRASSATRS